MYDEISKIKQKIRGEVQISQTNIFLNYRNNKASKFSLAW